MLQFGPRRSLLSHANEPLVFEVQLLKVLWFPSIRWLFQKLLTTPKLHDQHRRGLLVLSDPFAEEVGVIIGVVRGSSLVFSKKIVKIVSVFNWLHFSTMNYHKNIPPYYSKVCLLWSDQLFVHTFLQLYTKKQITGRKACKVMQIPILIART